MDKTELSYLTMMISTAVIGRVIESVNGDDLNGMNRGVLEGIITRRIIERSKTAKEMGQ